MRGQQGEGGNDAYGCSTVFVCVRVCVSASMIACSKHPWTSGRRSSYIAFVLVMLLATAMTTTGLVVLYGALLGLVTGVRGAIYSVVWPSLFGRKALGKIGGTVS